MKMKKTNVLVICFLVITVMLLSGCEIGDGILFEKLFDDVEFGASKSENAMESDFEDDSQENSENDVVIGTYKDDGATSYQQEYTDVPPPNKPSPAEAKYNQYIKKAQDIEAYSRTYLDNATSQAELNKESYNVYVKWDNLLNEVYQYLKANMNSKDFAALKSDEINWIKEKENAMNETEQEWAGGSGAPMARNLTGIEYTSSRSYYLISRVLECD